MDAAKDNVLSYSIFDKWRDFLNSPLFEKLITCVIISNAIALGIISSTAFTGYHYFFKAIDTVCIFIYCIEISAKIILFRSGYFKSVWNIVDFLIVSVALIPQQSSYVVLRVIRMLRVMRLITGLPAMRRMVNCIILSIPGVSSVLTLLFVIFYVSAIITTRSFGIEFPEWFGTIDKSMYTLFQVMTLESWSMGIVRPVMESNPLAWLFFVPFIIFSSFTVLNLFIAIIVEAMSKARAEEDSAQSGNVNAVTTDSDFICSKIESIESDLKELKSRLKRN